MSEQIKLIAQRIKELREISDISITEMAENLKLSGEEYAKYEEGAIDIPVSMLYEIASFFNVDLTEILSGEAPKLHIFQVVRKGKGLEVFRREQYKYHNLAYNFSKKQIEPFTVEVPVTPDDELLHENSHPGQEFNYVLEGKLLIRVNGKDNILEEGDSIYFNSVYMHGMKALDGKKAKFLAIILND